jgi:hypothetical protein
MIDEIDSVAATEPSNTSATATSPSSPAASVAPEAGGGGDLSNLTGRDLTEAVVNLAFDQAEGKVGKASPLQGLKSPDVWPQEYRDFFDQLTDPATQQWILDRWGEITGQMKPLEEYRQRAEEYYGQVNQTFEALNQTWGPVAQALSLSRGLQVQPHEAQQLAARYFGWYLSDPKGFIEAFAKHAGVTVQPQSHAEPSGDGDVDPAIAGLREQVAQTQRAIEAQRQALLALQQGVAHSAQVQQQQARHHEAAKALHAFATERDEKGNLLRQHISNADVVKTMAALMSQYPNEYDLTKAYEFAVRLVPPPAPTMNERARAAKLASSGVSSGANLKVDPTAGESLRQTITRLVEAQLNGE